METYTSPQFRISSKESNAEEVIRHLEQKYELTPVASSWESFRAADSEGQIRREKRFASLGAHPQESIKRRLQNLCDIA